ncbi:ATP-dependent helicase HrpB [Pectobacterium atrosepticum]|uniref:ATP-dependent helicase HrpB n=1 Tax=Pectobacterium atrosepticum TaxID=29471 RepID=UPI00049A43D5|nr:ATP-dependent helicase HrpB [Pectobacterium atrosepticum]GKV84670.1 ATP-dependent RNA helicase HrpB [Pectobacterium carotovorum subsp. carotovorum]AIA72135.1 ATP-dependent helicase HrpB [Pectobacterium atrosepticum]AIK15103.1 ATP-dependent helicase [Pectobacterium atrosepticum]KFX15224.1 ATP-dependent helicase HrpB [Pectobacterium atrosepticum]KMK81127.1 ATP-dependent RNA helicase HrpB [Pectobacterium atrosepticum ICMP 1526]
MILPPVSAVLDDVITALHTAPQVLLNAPTGAGKSTWLPLQLLQQGNVNGRIIMLEPRRLAAKSVAWRLAQQLGEELGQTIGYRMRSESRVSAATKLEVVTEGMLTRLLQQDAELQGVGLIILDEFHERSVQADLALALLLDVQQGLRDDLTLLIMSATLDNARLSALLPEAICVVSEGRSYPVERCYAPLNSQDRFEEGVARQVRRLLNEEAGSLLLFLPGVAEIRRVQALLENSVSSETDLCPLYGALTLAEQQKAILPAERGRRKVVLATNIAETSLTIEGIRLVMDSGLERVASFDVKSGVTRLVTQRISQASMVQRAGRAGRLSPGICWHLCSREQAERAAAQSEAEILNSDLSSVWLDLLQWGCTDVAQLTWLDTPPAPALYAARQLLCQLGITDDQGRLTAEGRKIAALGCDARLATMLYAASQQSAEALATAGCLAAILEEPPRSGSINLADWLHRPLPHWLRRAKQLTRRLSTASGHIADFGHIDSGEADWLLAQAFPDRIARRRSQDGRYQLANGSGAMMSADEALSGNEWLLAPALLQNDRLMQNKQSADARILLALPLDIERLERRLPGLINERNVVHWDEEKGTLRASQRDQIGCLILRRRPLNKPSDEVLQQAMLSWIREQGLKALNWDAAALQLRARLQCAHQWLNEVDWPRVDDDTLLATLDIWLQPSLSGVRDLRALHQINLSDALLRRLDWSLRQRLDSALPTHYTAPGGSRLPIAYYDDKPPVLSVRMQEMFGEQKSPLLAEGRVALVLELLSPAQRPLQITRDLAAFWQGTYREVQKEMKGRYPKHIWPDDPANTAPTRRTKKYQNH